jgi:uncharacterized membrane protein
MGLAMTAATPGEPPAVATQAKAAPAALQAKALAHPHLKFCSGKLGSSGDVHTLPCRLAVLAEASAATATTTTPAGLKGTRAAIDAALGAADWVSGYAPTEPSPGLRRARFASHKAACGIVFQRLAALEARPKDDPGHDAVQAALTSTPSLRTKACDCAKRTAALAVGANASPAEQAEIQGILTTERCFMTATEPNSAAPKGPEGLSNASGETQALVEASSPAGRLIALAQGRAVEFSRCADKGMKDGAITDEPKLSLCACNVAKRWALPLRKDDPRVVADVPVAKGAVLPITVEGGKIAACGPARAAP